MSDIIEKLKTDKIINQLDLERNTDKPWGAYITYARNAECTPKILVVEDDLSIQLHHHRDEIWHLVCGEAIVYKGKKYDDDRDTIANLEAVKVTPGDLVYLPREMVHTVVNVGNEPALVVEVSLGDAEEDDIVRIYDKHSRSDVKDDFPQKLSTADLMEWCKNN